MIDDKGLYGLRSSATQFHEQLAAKLRSMGFCPTKVDNDFWIRKQADHYEYLATYLMIFWLSPANQWKSLMMSRDAIRSKVSAPPNTTLEAILTMSRTNSGKRRECLLHCQLVPILKSVMEKLEKLCGVEQLYKANSPMSDFYHPKTDNTLSLDDEHASKY
jgi:hypothetical protein